MAQWWPIINILSNRLIKNLKIAINFSTMGIKPFQKIKQQRTNKKKIRLNDLSQLRLEQLKLQFDDHILQQETLTPEIQGTLSWFSQSLYFVFWDQNESSNFIIKGEQMLISPEEPLLQLSQHSKSISIRSRHKNRNSTTLQFSQQHPYQRKISHAFFCSRNKQKWNNLVFSRLLLDTNDDLEEKDKRKCKLSMINIYCQSQEQYFKTKDKNTIYLRHFLKDKSIDRDKTSPVNRPTLSSQPERTHRNPKRTIRVSNPLLKQKVKPQKPKQQNVEELLITKLMNKKPEQLLNKKKRRQKGKNFSTEFSREPIQIAASNTISQATQEEKSRHASLKIRKKSSYITPW